MFHKRITLCRWLGLSSSSRLKFLMTRSRLVIVLKSVNNTYLQSQRSLFLDLSECSHHHHHHLLSKPAIHTYIPWNDHQKSPLAQMRIMRSLRIGDGRSKIYLQKDFEQEILNLEVLEILKKQEILYLVNKHAFFQLWTPEGQLSSSAKVNGKSCETA